MRNKVPCDCGGMMWAVFYNLGKKGQRIKSKEPFYVCDKCGKKESEMKTLFIYLSVLVIHFLMWAGIFIGACLIVKLIF